MRAETGRVDYSERAFQQDAHDAMRGDIIRALIETITNSDDAYGDKDGKIRVEIEHRRGPWKVITRDRAKGMSATRMKTAIGQLGGRTSGFEEGERVRGNLGRGAKDLAAFGTVLFESICDGKYAKMTLQPTGKYELQRERTAKPEDRESLGIPRNGTVVTIHVEENHRCPQHGKLLEKLCKRYQLRDILSDPRREVQLVDPGKGNTDILRYTVPDLPVVFSGRLAIEGYPRAIAEVTIFRNPERYEDPPSDSCRPGGLLLTGRRAIYENTLFSFESNPHAGWFSGRVKCDFIDELAAEYDRRLVAHEPKEEVNNYRLEGGSFGPSSIRNRLSSWTGSPSCSAMYCLISASVMVPEVTAKYPRAHRWRPQNCFRRWANSWRSIRELIPLSHWTIWLTLWYGR